MTVPPLPAPALPPPRTLAGIGLMAAGFFCYSVSDTAAKLLTADLPPIQVAFVRSLGLLAVALVLFARQGLRLLATRRPLLQISRGVVAALSSATFIFAIGRVPLADAVAVSFVAPFLVTLLGALILREPVGLRRWLAVLVGFLGTLVVIRPGLGVFDPAMFLVVVAALMFAVRQVLSRLLGPTEPTATTIAYTALGSAVLLAVPALLAWQWPEGPRQVLLLVLLAGMAGLGEVLVIRALELAQAVVLAPLQYSLIIWGTAFGWLVFHQLPDLWTLVGAAVIVASGIYTLYRERLAAARRGRGEG